MWWGEANLHIDWLRIFILCFNSRVFFLSLEKGVTLDVCIFLVINNDICKTHFTFDKINKIVASTCSCNPCLLRILYTEITKPSFYINFVVSTYLRFYWNIMHTWNSFDIIPINSQYQLLKLGLVYMHRSNEWFSFCFFHGNWLKLITMLLN